MATALLVITLMVALLLGMPVAFALGISSLIVLLFMGTIPIQIMPQMMANTLDSYGILAIPFFILAAQIMNRGGVTDRMMNFANIIVGPIRGGLAHVNIMTSMLFAGMSGSAVADAAGEMI